VRLYAGEAAQSLMPVVERIQTRTGPADLPDVGDRRLFAGS